MQYDKEQPELSPEQEREIEELPSELMGFLEACKYHAFYEKRKYEVLLTFKDDGSCEYKLLGQQRFIVGLPDERLRIFYILWCDIASAGKRKHIRNYIAKYEFCAEYEDMWNDLKKKRICFNCLKSRNGNSRSYYCSDECRQNLWVFLKSLYRKPVKTEIQAELREQEACHRVYARLKQMWENRDKPSKYVN